MTLFDKQEFNVNMNGAEYLEYKKYNDNRSKLSKKQKLGVVYIISSAVLFIILMITITSPVPVESDSGMLKYHSDIIFSNGFSMPLTLIYFVIIMIALLWLIHGFGFIIIKR